MTALDRIPETTLDDRIRERRADRTFRARSRPDGTPDGDAPDHVVCVVVDALRADVIGPETTPFLAGLAGTAAVSPSTWTFPAVSSLLSGRYPHDHGAMRETDAFESSVADMTPLPPQLDGELTTLPEALAGAGYDTYGAFGMIVPFLALSGRFGRHALYDGADAETLLDDHEAWLTERRDRRTFSYLHLGDLHEPVDPPAAYWDAHDVADLPGVREWRHEAVTEESPAVERYRTHRRRLYRAAAEYVDNRLGAHYRRLSDLTGEDGLLFLAVGDHGEAFWERADRAAARFADPRPAYCVGHGGAPFEAVTRVPFRVAGGELTDTIRSGETTGERSDESSGRGVVADPSVSLVDVAPTVRDVVGIARSGGDGRSLLRSQSGDRTLLVEGVRYGYEKKATYADGWKLVVSRGDDVRAYLSLPGETPGDPPPEVADALRSALPPWPDGERVGSPVSPAVERRLADLGYQ